MLPYHPLTDPPGRTPAGHLDRRRESLDHLGQHLREGVADVVAQAVAGVVRDTVLALLAAPHPRSSAPPRQPSGDCPPPLWDDGDEGLAPGGGEVFSSAW